MFFNKLLNLHINFRIKKSIQYQYKLKNIDSILNQINCILVYFIDFISTESFLQLQTILKVENLKSIQIKKNFSKKLKIKFLTFLFMNNSFLIYSLDPIFKNNFYNIFKQINLIKNISCIGLFLNKKFFRPSEIQLLNKNKKITLIQQICIFIIIQQKVLISKLILLKKKKCQQLIN